MAGKQEILDTSTYTPWTLYQQVAEGVRETPKMQNFERDLRKQMSENRWTLGKFEIPAEFQGDLVPFSGFIDSGYPESFDTVDDSPLEDVIKKLMREFHLNWVASFPVKEGAFMITRDRGTKKVYISYIVSPK